MTTEQEIAKLKEEALELWAAVTAETMQVLAATRILKRTVEEARTELNESLRVKIAAGFTKECKRGIDHGIRALER